jgi:hypothetical protein
MKTYFKNRTQSAQTTLAYLLNSPPDVLLRIPILSTFISSLEHIVNSILAADQVQTNVAKGAGPAREAKKKVLLRMAQSIGRAIMSFAATSENVTLENKMKAILLELEEKSDFVFRQRCSSILEQATANAGALTPYGVTSAAILIYTDTLNNYKNNESTVAVRELIIKRANATKAIQDLLSQAFTLMKRQIDPVIYSLPEDQNSYKEKYRESRRVIILGHRYTTFKGLVKVKDQPTVLSNANLEFRNEEGEVFSVKTDLNGKYTERIHPDIYSIYVTCPTFESFLIEGQKILPGEMRIENFELVPKP